MLQRKLPGSSVSPSKRLKRRFRSVVQSVNPRGFSTGLGFHLFPVFLFLLFLFLVYNLFAIRKIECLYDNSPCPPEISDKFQRYLGTNVLFLKQKYISSSIKQSHPIENISFGFKIFNILKVTIDGGNPPVFADVFLVQDLPVISMDTDRGSSESAGWVKPTQEIGYFLQTASASSFSLWDNGLMTPTSTGSAQIKFVISEKPDEKIVGSIYKLVKIVRKYLNIKDFQIVGQRVFLSQENQPDIIVSVPFDEGQVGEALQSFTYLATIKKDAKVIDLRFKNPIIR